MQGNLSNIEKEKQRSSLLSFYSNKTQKNNSTGHTRNN